eukprot:TRINITY_DN3819_c0_g1_i1.p1 TRINITY_DN3819_c0_g1~~TRINITY_DN3819_c0_g1_i1.p1  ORF type:complete len:191 (-),score=52.65 TRINITY_DN3819_c0_g1_i1:35-607(-)
MCIRDRSTGDLVTVAMSDDPAELHEIDLTGLKVPEEDSDVPFLIWFINPGSGGQTGAGILKHLNERYSVDESHGAAFALTGDPKRDHKPFKPYVRDGLYFLWDVLDSYVDMKRPIRTIVAGGDGTCVWVLNALAAHELSLIHISEPTRLLSISYAVFCLKKKKKKISNNDFHYYTNIQYKDTRRVKSATT